MWNKFKWWKIGIEETSNKASSHLSEKKNVFHSDNVGRNRLERNFRSGSDRT